MASSDRPEISEATWAQMDRLFTLVANSAEGFARFGYHVVPDCGGGEHELDPNDPAVHYELHVYELHAELMGGKDDGAEVFSGFLVYLTNVIAALTPQARQKSVLVLLDATLHAQHGCPTAVIEGVFEGRSVTVYVLSRPPEDAPVAMRVYQDGSFRMLDDDDGDASDDDDE